MSKYTSFNGDYYALDVDTMKGYSVNGEENLRFFGSHEDFLDFIEEKLGYDFRDAFDAECLYLGDVVDDFEKLKEAVESCECSTDNIILQYKKMRELLEVVKKHIDNLDNFLTANM